MRAIALLFLLFSAAPVGSTECTALQKALEVQLDDGTQCSAVITWLKPSDKDTGAPYQRIDIILTPPPLRCRADFNRDGRVNFLDASMLAGAIFGTDPLYDLDADLDVTLADVGLFRTVFFQSCEVTL